MLKTFSALDAWLVKFQGKLKDSVISFAILNQESVILVSLS